MKNQENIIDDVTIKFSEKFKDLAKVRINDPSKENKKEDPPVISITLLGIEEIVDRNINERIQLKGEDDNGDKIEYFVSPPTMFELTFMVTPYFKTYSDSLKVIGSIARLVKDNNTLEVGEYDWVTNNNSPIYISSLPGYNIEKQMQIFSMLRSEYRPSLFYRFVVGINSGNKDIFRRVEKRKIGAIPKKEDN